MLTKFTQVIKSTLRPVTVRTNLKSCSPTLPVASVHVGRMKMSSLSGSSNGGCGAPECCKTTPTGSKITSSTSPSSSMGSIKNLSTTRSTLASTTTATATSPVSPTTTSNLNFLNSLLASRQPGYSLPAPFYTDPITYQYDLKYMWGRAWLFAGYTCQLQKPGDYFTYEIGSDSIIIIRNALATPESSGLKAFHNTCRHRGSRIVTATQDTVHTKRLVCPYHQWGYERDGTLVHARDMDPEFKKEENGLNEVHCEEVEGLMFICLTPKAEKPMWSFEPARKLITPQLAPHVLKDAKIAYSSNYNVNSNWKLVYENNRECYHCAGSHPEYVKSNYDLHLTYKQNPDGSFERDLDPNYPGKDKILNYIHDKSKQWESLGISCSPDSSFPGDGWYRASRMPLKEGWVTESIDGQPVSTLMGRLPQRDMGSFRIHTLPNYWLHLSGDHGVSSRLTPTGPNTTEVRVDWIVHKDAVAGKDYHLEKMLPFWSKTSDQDWHLCEINMQGVSSSAYRPGRLSQRKEAGLDRFLNWYLNVMKTGLEKDQKQTQTN